MRLLLCRSCRLVQLADDGAPPEEYSAVLLRPPLSSTMRAHRAALARELAGAVDLAGGPLLDLASHGGNLAGELAAAGVTSTILDADSKRVGRLTQSGLRAYPLPSSVVEAGRLREELGEARMIVDMYVLSHTRRPAELLTILLGLAAADARLVIETEYLPPVLEAGRFDSVRHGHFSYFSLRSLEAPLGRAGWAAVDATRQPVYGGALRVHAMPVETSAAPTARLLALRTAEAAAGIEDDSAYIAFAERAGAVKQSLLELLRRTRRSGRRVAAYGAGSRASTMLNGAGLTTEVIEFTVDVDPAKHGRFMPGSHVPILAPVELERRDVDDILALAWDLAAEIEPTLPRRDGRRVILPLPVLEVRELEPAQRPARRATSGAAVSTSVPSER